MAPPALAAAKDSTSTPNRSSRLLTAAAPPLSANTKVPTRSSVRRSGWPLGMDAPLCDGHRGLADRLGQRRVGVGGAGDVLGAGAELDGEAGLCDQLGGVGPQDVEPEDPVAPGVGDHLDEAVPLAHRASPAVGREADGAGRDLETLRATLLL